MSAGFILARIGTEGDWSSTARGGVVDQKAMIKALQEQKVCRQLARGNADLTFEFYCRLPALD